MFNPNPYPGFLKRPEPKPETSLDLEPGIAYQKEFKNYFSNLFEAAGLAGATRFFSEPLPEQPEDFRYNDTSLSAYATVSLEIGDFIDSPAYRFELLTRKGNLQLLKEYSEEEVDRIMGERVNVDLIEKELYRNDLDEAKKNILELVLGLVGRRHTAEESGIQELPIGDAPHVGSCPKAEWHMLKFISGVHPSSDGIMNVILDKDGEPLMLEKINLGDDYSCFSLQPVMYKGFRIEAGAIFSVKEHTTTGVLDINDCKAFQFVRYSPLSIEPSERAKVAPGFSWQVDRHQKADINYDWVTPAIIAEFAAAEIQRLKK